MQQPPGQAIPIFIGLEYAVGNGVAPEKNTAALDGSNDGGLLPVKYLQFSSVSRLPILVQVNNHRNYPVISVLKLIQVFGIPTARRIVGEVKLIAGKTQKTIPVKDVDDLIYQLPEWLKFGISPPIQPVS